MCFQRSSAGLPLGHHMTGNLKPAVNSLGTCDCLNDCLQEYCFDKRILSDNSNAERCRTAGLESDLDLLLETVLLCLLAPAGGLQLRQLLLGLHLLSGQVVRALAQALQQQATRCHAARRKMDASWAHGDRRVADKNPCCSIAEDEHNLLATTRLPHGHALYILHGVLAGSNECA